MTEYDDLYIEQIRPAIPGSELHGELSVLCPYCGRSKEITFDIISEKNHVNGYCIIKCPHCGKLYKEKL